MKCLLAKCLQMSRHFIFQNTCLSFFFLFACNTKRKKLIKISGPRIFHWVNALGAEVSKDPLAPAQVGCLHQEQLAPQVLPYT
jgi:hypothetical protein